MKKTNRAITFMTILMLASNTVQADLISTQNEENSSDMLISRKQEQKENDKEEVESYLISAEKQCSNEKTDSTENKSESKDRVLISDIDKDSIEKYIHYEAIDEFDVEDILSRIDLNESEEVLNYDYIIKNYTYRDNMEETYRKINDDAVSVIDRYMQKTEYIPIKDPLWFLALGALEYNYANNDSDIICSWPISVSDYNNTPEYMLAYNWKTVQNMLGVNAVTRRSGGAIGPFQLESFYAKGVSPILPDEFGLIGSAENRQDCWVTLGQCSESGSSIVWQQGTYADRWSIADSANICLAVYDETLRRVQGRCALNELQSKYEKVTFLMWAHNRGTGILNNRDYMDKSKKICSHVDELTELIYSLKPNRFSRSSELMQEVRKICSDVDCDEYPVMSLISYLIVEARYSGAW